MAELGVVRRYARALFDVARQQELVEQVATDLRGLEAVLKSAPHLGRVLRTPTIPAGRKRNLVRSVFHGRVNELTLRFMELAIAKKREEVLSDVPGEFQRLSYEMLNLLPVEVTSAVELTAEERTRLCTSLSSRTGKRIELRERIDPALMGGALVRIEDTIIDGSVRGHLRRLRQRLLNPLSAGATPA